MGKLIVIEESCHGVGKSMQYRLLIDRLIKDNNNVITTHHFPSYGTYQARPVEEYLNGNYGKISDLSPYFVNSLYAQDRAITWISGLKEEYDKGGVIILDRYTTSSLIYQSSAIEDIKEREEFIDYIYDYEHNKIGLPKPDLVIFLYAPFEKIREIKSKKKTTDGTKNDIHERDFDYLKRVSDTSISIANKYNWSYVECIKNNEMIPQDKVHEEIYSIVSKIL